MNNRTFFLILAIYIPTIIWGIIGYIIYQATIQEQNFIKNIGFLDILLSQSLFVRLLIIFASYLLTIAIGLIFYAEEDFWKTS